MKAPKVFKNLKGMVRSLDREAQGVVDWEYEGKWYKVKLPFTLPKEEVEWEAVKKRRKKPLGSVIKTLQSSPHRTPARCPHFSICGGCRLQHLSYPQQLAYKEEKIQAYFTPFFKNTQALIRPIIPCDPPWGYRNKMSFSFGEDKNQQTYLGLHQIGKKRVINIQDCAICPPWMSAILGDIYEWWGTTDLRAYNYNNNTGTFRELTLKEGWRSQDRFVMLSINAKPEYAPTKAQLDEFVSVVQLACKAQNQDSSLSIFLKLHQVIKGKPTQIYELHLAGPTTIKERLYLDSQQLHSLEFILSPQAFFQPNTLQAEKIYQQAFSLLNTQKLGVVYDLYCGTGIIGAFAAKLGAERVYSVELKKESLMDGQENAKNNGIENQEFIWGDVQQVIEEKSRRQRGMLLPDVVVVDPPRAGLGPKALSHLLSCKPHHILYISCNPETQAKDLQLLMEDYELKTLQPIDQFPHTLHVENIALLKKISK